MPQPALLYCARSGQELAHMSQPALLYCVPGVVKSWHTCPNQHFYTVCQEWSRVGTHAPISTFILCARSGQELAHMPQPALLYCVPCAHMGSA